MKLIHNIKKEKNQTVKFENIPIGSTFLTEYNNSVFLRLKIDNVTSLVLAKSLNINEKNLEPCNTDVYKIFDEPMDLYKIYGVDKYVLYEDPDWEK